MKRYKRGSITRRKEERRAERKNNYTVNKMRGSSMRAGKGNWGSEVNEKLN